MSDLPFVAASAVTTDAHIRHHPHPDTSITPSTAADTKLTIPLPSSSSSHVDLSNIDEESEYVNSLSSSIVDYASSEPLPSSASHHHSRRYSRGSLPPLPDLRFEQSYLAGIKKAVEEGKWWLVGFITVRDQVVMPMLQGVLWNLGVSGWRYWNRSARFKGAGAGARLRRWWWDTNNWKYPKQ